MRNICFFTSLNDGNTNKPFGKQVKYLPNGDKFIKKPHLSARDNAFSENISGKKPPQYGNCIEIAGVSDSETH